MTSVNKNTRKLTTTKITDENFDVDYIENFLIDKYANNLFKKLENVEYDSDEQSSIIIYGKKYNIPRKQTSYGEPNLTYKYSNNEVSPRNWNDTEIGMKLKKIAIKLSKITGVDYNFCLINNYKDGSNSIGYHSDDEKELGDNPIIAGLSLGSARKIYFKSNKTKDVKILNLKHNSVFLMRGTTNKYWKHSIPKTTKPLGRRISLTFRKIIM
ncbi:MAG: alpha-ketoglutarate-dependent dioxygenase AlkB [Magnetococcales bacterium]|nr:alpha-ketoglutarate-dependent dioxygenase AlkB [Magnetococcales bacterium]|tara:strand:- start:1098 stop:1733 length:636 start_codon:yes stop_codon:yes gene_type:complete